MRAQAPLRGFLIQSAAWTALCVITELVCKFFLHLGLPYTYPGIIAYTSFADFHSFVPKFAYFHSFAFFTHGAMLPYPPAAVVFYKLFLTPQPANGKIAVPLFAAAILLVSWVMLVAFARALLRRGMSRASVIFSLAVMYLISFPFWFDFLNGNIEFIIWALVTLGLGLYWRRSFALAAVCFGVAGAMKLFPFVFVGLFLARKQYRALGIAVATAVLLTIVSIWLIDPNFTESWKYSLGALGQFGHEHVRTVQPVVVGFDHSLFALLKRLMEPFVPERAMKQVSLAYVALAALAGSFLYIARIRKLPFVNQVLCLTVAAVLLPPVSYDYTLLHLYAPLAFMMFVLLQHLKNGESRPIPGAAAAIALLAFLLSAQSEFIHGGVRFAAQIKCLALLALGYVALKYPFPLEAHSDLPGAAHSAEAAS